jgi:hypothetical protein
MRFREGNAATFALGEQATGPVVLLAAYPEGASVFRSPAHSHRSDTFRMAVGPGAQQFRDGARWLGHGDFHLMGANDRYVETMGADGVGYFLLTADRRGWPHGYEQNVDNDELLAAWPATSEKYFEKEGFWPFHESDDQAVHGMKASFAPLPKERRLWGSFTNRDGWRVMSDGSEVAVMLLADSEHGPAVIVSHNQPNTDEIGHHRLGTDTFRLILDESVQVGETPYGPGQFRQSPAGHGDGAVLHGPDGSSQGTDSGRSCRCSPHGRRRSAVERTDSWGELQRELTALIST